MSKEIYLNGNYITTIDSNGTKKYRALRIGEDLISNFPDSIDLKITDKCSIGCPYCHESSVINGKSFNLKNTIELLSKLPNVGIEIAIGGGDILSIDENDLRDFFLWLDKTNFNIRITLNIKSIENVMRKNKIEIDTTESFFNIFPEKIFPCRGRGVLYSGISIGISINKFDKKLINYIEDYCEEVYASSSIVYHVIAGIIPLNDLEELLNSGRKVLILGYKSWGRGKTMKPLISLEDTSNFIKRYIFKLRDNLNNKFGVLGFDNLAIEQLDIKNSFSDKEWNRIYMGNEFTHSMYVDAVNEEFAPTSRDPKRDSWSKYPGGIVEYFQKNKVQ